MFALVFLLFFLFNKILLYLLVCPSASSLTDQSGDITSPFYPRRYPNNQDCRWNITASKGNRVKLEITNMEIENCGAEGACTCDFLEIQDGFNGQDGAASGKLCIDENFTQGLTILLMSS